MSSINLKNSFISSVKLRGIGEGETAAYAKVLSELAEFLSPMEPGDWSMPDLERFLKIHVVNLSASERRCYAVALGVISEILERSRRSGVDLIYVPEPSTTLDTEEVAYDRTFLAPGPFARVRTPPPSVPPEALISHKRRSGLFNSLTSESDAMLSGFGQRSPSTESLSRLQVEWNEAGGFLHLLWAGSVPGEEMRAKLRLGLSLQRTYKATRWLADMRASKVMNQDDADWFSGWIQRVERSGAKHFAVVIPEHIITKLQLGRICGITGSFFLSTARIGTLNVHFYDTSSEAKIWLMNGVD